MATPIDAGDAAGAGDAGELGRAGAPAWGRADCTPTRITPPASSTTRRAPATRRDICQTRRDGLNGSTLPSTGTFPTLTVSRFIACGGDLTLGLSRAAVPLSKGLVFSHPAV